MKGKITIGAIALCCALGLSADDSIETTQISNDNSFNRVLQYWRPNQGQMKKRPGGTIAQDPGGRSGSCMRITNTPAGFVALYSAALIPVDTKTDTFKLSLWVCGKGAFRIGFYSYDAKRKYVSSELEGATAVDSGEWIRKEYTIPASKFRGAPEYVRIAMEVNPGTADLRFDDFSGVRETRLVP